MIPDELLAIERELGDGPGDAYRRHLTGDAVLTYRWRSRRGEMTYAAAMSTVYVLHQQTPEP